MFSTSFSTGTGTEPRVYATVQEAAAAAVNELRRARSAREKEEYDQVQRKQRAEMILGQYDQVQRKQRAETILGQYDLLMKYAVENDISIPQTRAYFRKVSLGIETEAVIKNWFPSP